MIIVQNILSFLSAEVFLITTAVLMLVFSSFKKEHNHKILAKIVSSIFLITIMIIVFGGGFSNQNLDKFLVNNMQTSYFKIMILLIAVCNVFLSAEWLTIKKFIRFEYPLFLMLSVGGMLIIVSSKCLITLYLGLELAYLPLYLLIAFKRRAMRSTIAGTRALSWGVIVSAIYLYGASLIYGATGYLDFQDIAVFVTDNSDNTLLIAGFFMLITSLLFKCDIAPFNLGVTEIAEGAPTPVTSFLLTIPKVACFGVFIRLWLEVLEPLMPIFMPVLLLFATVSMMFGSIAMIFQTNIKRFLAFASMTYSGYILASLVSLTNKDIAPTLFLLVAYSIGMTGLFAIILSFRKNGNLIENISDIQAFSRRKPLASILLIFFIFSILGFPPFLGFYGIFSLFTALLQKKLYFLTVFAVISIMFAIVGFAKIINVTCFKETDEAFDDIGFNNKLVLLLCFAIMLIFSIYPFFIAQFAKSMVF